MTIGPEPRTRIFEMSVRLGIMHFDLCLLGQRLGDAAWGYALKGRAFKARRIVPRLDDGL